MRKRNGQTVYRLSNNIHAVTRLDDQCLSIPAYYCGLVSLITTQTIMLGPAGLSIQHYVSQTDDSDSRK